MLLAEPIVSSWKARLALDFARPLADQYIVMERGEILKQGAGPDMDRDGVKALLAV